MTTNNTYIPNPKHITLEEPDRTVIIDFLGNNSRKKKDRRACVVKLEIENGKLWVYVKGCDDRATILLDEVLELPEEDKRS